MNRDPHRGLHCQLVTRLFPEPEQIACIVPPVVPRLAFRSGRRSVGVFFMWRGTELFCIHGDWLDRKRTWRWNGAHAAIKADLLPELAQACARAGDHEQAGIYTACIVARADVLPRRHTFWGCA